MSFGDPNNPYGQQPGQPPQGQQPGYGYPQGQPQQGQQPGYGYPQAPPVQQAGYGYPGGYPAAPTEMPGGIKAARVMLWVMSAFQVIAGIFLFAAMGAVDDAVNNADTTADTAALADFGKGIVAFLAVLMLIFAALSITLALKMKSGGNATRICAIVYGAFAALGGLVSLPLGIVTLALGILIIVFVAKSDGAAWFQRPRY
ncbi:hypothetical protein [Streptomyces sp. NPDC051569]|uniref:hypothetical protein n=1 Tax=Streptomyces sp. NPDC051569 TaxID=3365661 RepID=UPI0037BDF920